MPEPLSIARRPRLRGRRILTARVPTKWGAAIAAIVLALVAAPVAAQPDECVRDRKNAPVRCSERPKKPPIFDMKPMDIGGKLRGATLLYFLERANEELERASLEKRSFIPEMVRTLDEEAL
jgi:hypothetical protein